MQPFLLRLLPKLSLHNIMQWEQLLVFPLGINPNQNWVIIPTEPVQMVVPTACGTYYFPSL
jgi:hypothetical protein